MKRLRERNGIIGTVLAVLTVTVAFASLVNTRQAQSQAQSQPQMSPERRMPMMGSNQSRWMWPHHRMMRGMQGRRMGPGMSPWMGRGASMVRHMYYMHNGIPSEYRGKSNPLSASPEVVREGATLYADNCASCHGARGFGDGEAGQELRPLPANLAHMIRMPMLNDAYLFWTVSEGGEPLQTAMPAYKDALKAEEIWKIVIAMRAGFPSPPQESKSSENKHDTSVTPKGDWLSTDDVRGQIERWIEWYGNPKLKVGSISVKGEHMIIAEIVGEKDSVVQRIEVDRRTGWMRTIR